MKSLAVRVPDVAAFREAWAPDPGSEFDEMLTYTEALRDVLREWWESGSPPSLDLALRIAALIPRETLGQEKAP